MHELLEAGAILASRLTLTYQGGVGGKDHTLLHAVVDVGGDLGILKLIHKHTDTKLLANNTLFFRFWRLSLIFKTE